MSLRVKNIGKIGNIVDSDYAHSPSGAFTRTQNINRDPLGKAESIITRLGLTPFNVDDDGDLAGAVLGGIGVPLRNRFTGTREFFIGRGEAL